MEKFEQSPKQERSIEQDRLAFVEAIKNIEIGEIDTKFDEKSVESLISELGEVKLLLLGETHGVKENVDIIYTLFKKFGFKKLALEWDEKLREQADKFCGGCLKISPPGADKRTRLTAPVSMSAGSRALPCTELAAFRALLCCSRG